MFYDIISQFCCYRNRCLLIMPLIFCKLAVILRKNKKLVVKMQKICYNVIIYSYADTYIGDENL